MHAMYESRDASIHHAMPLPPLIRDPDGSTAAAWDVMQVSLLIYLATVLPLRACFAIDVPAASPAFVFDVFTDIVFIIDNGQVHDIIPIIFPRTFQHTIRCDI